MIKWTKDECNFYTPEQIKKLYERFIKTYKKLPNFRAMVNQRKSAE